MIRHVLTFSFRADADPATCDAVLAELETFPDRFPAMRGWALGPNISRRDDTFAYAFVVDFADEDALAAYLSSEEHETFVTERWKPVVDHRAITTFAVPGAAPVPGARLGPSTASPLA